MYFQISFRRSVLVIHMVHLPVVLSVDTRLQKYITCPRRIYIPLKNDNTFNHIFFILKYMYWIAIGGKHFLNPTMT